MRDFLISQLKTLPVKSESKLLEYVEYCLSRQNTVLTEVSIARHHILPKVYFREYENFDVYIWNKVLLTFNEHTEAHRLLYQAMYSYKLAYAYVTCSIVSQDYANNAEWRKAKTAAWKEWANSLGEDGVRNIVTSVKKGHQTKRRNGYHKEWGKIMSAFLREEVVSESGEIATRAKINYERGLHTKKTTVLEDGSTIHQRAVRSATDWKMREVTTDEGVTSTNQKEVVKRSIRTKRTVICDNGLTILENASLKASESLNRPYICTETGDVTTRGKENMKRARQGLNKKLDNELVTYNGVAMTLREARRVKMKDTKRKLSKRYIVCGDGAPPGELLSTELYQIHSKLIHTTADAPLGHTEKSASTLRKYNKSHMIGWYVKLCE